MPSRGFSLIELLIVVAIILIIAAIAIPNLLRARIAANEASAGAMPFAISTPRNLPTTRRIHPLGMPPPWSTWAGSLPAPLLRSKPV